MHSSTRTSYLETEVMTAAPQKLQLMLIEAAMRLIERARGHWRAEENEPAHEALIRAQRIVTELLAGLNYQVEPQLTKKVAAVYVFVFRSVVEANLKRDEKKLDDAMKVLRIERETWREVCRRLGSSNEAGNRSAEVSLAQPASEPQAPPRADAPSDSGDTEQASGGLSLEA